MACDLLTAFPSRCGREAFCNVYATPAAPRWESLSAVGLCLHIAEVVLSGPLPSYSLVKLPLVDLCLVTSHRWPPLPRIRHESTSGTPESKKHTLICLFLLRLLLYSIRIPSTLPSPPCLIRKPPIARLSTHSVKKFSCVSVFLSLSFTYPPHSPQVSRSLATFTSYLEFTGEKIQGS